MLASAVAVTAMLSLAGCGPTMSKGASDALQVGGGTLCASPSQRIHARFDARSAWTLCWDHSIETGLVITSASYSTPDNHSTPVLTKASLAQIDVPYDNGSEEHLDLPGFGLTTTALSPRECSGTVLSIKSFKDVACAQILNDGLRYEWSDYDFGTGNHSRRGQCLEVFEATPADWYTYITAWDFCDDGEIQARVGAGGTLAPGHYSDPTTGTAIGPGQSQLAVNHYHNVFWRIQPDLDGTTVAQVDTSGSGAVRATTVTPITVETARDTAGSRLWELISNKLQNSHQHPESYDLLVQNADPYRRADHAYTNDDVYVTQQRNCELIAAKNFHPPCSTEVDQFVNGEKLAKPVLWVQSSFHHRPRDEDAPTMDEKWLSFELVPRGVSGTNPLAQVGK